MAASIVTSLFLMTSYLLIQSVTSQPPATKNVEEVFKGKCLDYKHQRRYGSTNGLPKVTATCDELWASFEPCTRTIAGTPCNYTDFLTKAFQTPPKGKTLLYSGTAVLAHEFNLGGRRYVTLEDTLIGYLADNLDWCPKDSCTHEDTQDFWAGASSQLARESSGLVQVMLNGSSKVAYKEDKEFAKHEVTNLTNKVKPFKVLLVNYLNDPVESTCDSDNIKALEKAINAKSIPYECESQSKPVRLSLCVDEVDHPQCRLKLKPNSSKRSPRKGTLSNKAAKTTTTAAAAGLTPNKSVRRERSDQKDKTENLEKVFKGRCIDYKHQRRITRGILPEVNTTCQELWNEFQPCTTNVNCDLTDFFIKAAQTLPQDKTLLYSATSSVLAHDYSLGGKRHVTLEDTLIGYLVDNLVWCAPIAKQQCTRADMEVYWAGAQKQFARTSSGLVNVMLDGTQDKAYDKESEFAKYQVTNLTKEINTLRVLLENDLNAEVKTNCESNSIKTMEADIQKVESSINFLCESQPKSVRLALCVDKSDDPQCEFAAPPSSTARPPPRTTKLYPLHPGSGGEYGPTVILGVGLLIVAMASAAAFAVYYWFLKKKSGKEADEDEEMGGTETTTQETTEERSSVSESESESDSESGSGYVNPRVSEWSKGSSESSKKSKKSKKSKSKKSKKKKSDKKSGRESDRASRSSSKASRRGSTAGTDVSRASRKDRADDLNPNEGGSEASLSSAVN